MRFLIVLIAFLTHDANKYDDCMSVASVSGDVIEAVTACGKP